MRVLGISCDFHDAAAAVVVEGEIVAAAEEERFTRRKHDSSMPEHAIASVLSIAGLTPDDLDRVVFHEKPLLTIARVVAARQRRGPRALGTFARELPPLLRRNLMVSLRIERALRELGATRPPRLHFSEHHLSHAAAAYLPSPFESAAILTVDGIGEWATASIGRGVRNRVDLLAEQRYPDSLGLLYSLATAHCGFAPNDGEYKLMGLAPYGEPRFRERLDEILELHPDGSLTIDDAAVGWWTGSSRVMDAIFEGPPLPQGADVGRREADIARSVQELTEDVVLAMANHAHELTGESNLCMAGGVALNCVANGRVLREGPFDDIWIQPAAGDAGSAIGAALWLTHVEEGVARPDTEGRDRMRHALLGPAMAGDDIDAWLEAGAVPHRRVTDRDERCREVAAALADGRFVGWFEGRMEFGPRALGHRSILADPRSPTAQRDINLRVKGREAFRPFAPAVLEERAKEWFEVDRPAPYMLTTVGIAESRRDGEAVDPSAGLDLELPDDVRSELPACTHVDYSARVQTVGDDRDDGFRHLLEAFDEITGCPVLVNTSFNQAGEPIVCTPDHALATARNAGLDLLVLEDCLVEVADIPDSVPPGDWAGVPAAPADDESAGTGPLLTAAAVAVVAVLGPALRAGRVYGWGTGAAVGGALAAGAICCGLLGERRWLPRLAVIVAAGGATFALAGTHTAAWGVLGLALSDLVLRRWSPLPGAPRGDADALPALVVISLVAAWKGSAPDHEGALQVLLGVMAFVATVTTLFPGRAGKLVAGLRNGVDVVISRGGSWILGVLVVLLPWLAQRIVGIDPLRPGDAHPATAWKEREPGGVRPQELWRRDPFEGKPPMAWRLRRAAGAFIVIAVIGSAGTFGTRYVVERVSESSDEASGNRTGNGSGSGQSSSNPGGGPVHENTDPSKTPAALADADWYPKYRDDIAWLWQTTIAWDPLAPLRLKDVNTSYINIKDGARKSWRPPACSCRRVRIWMYGGSTGFGLGQRDEYTIASEIAKAAWKEGIAVDIDNRGVVGDHHWEEANRFAWDLATLKAPDMVIFLDGINDVQQVDRMKERSRQPLSFIKDDFWRNYLSVAPDMGMDGRWAPSKPSDYAPAGDSVPTTIPLQFDSAGEAGTYVAQRYEMARTISSTLAKAHGIDAEWFWQPSIEMRPEIPGEPAPNGRDWSKERYLTALQHVGSEVHDITRALDGLDQPLYWDQFHTNETGAARIGDVMYDTVAPAVRRFAGTAR